MTIRRIGICAAQIPFNYGGAEILVEELNRQLKIRGFESEIINIPFKWYPKDQLIDNALIWRMLDLTESNGEKIDRVICTKYPTYAVKHPNKVLWLFHQHRPIYDLLNTEYTDFDKGDIEDVKYIQQIKNIDNLMINESKKIFTISHNVSERLNKYNGIQSEVLYPPTQLESKFKYGSYNNYILSAGRLDPLKRLELMIKAMEYVKSDVKFLIAGKGKHEDELRKLVHNKKLEKKVEFLGFVDEEKLLDLYANAGAIYFAPKDEDYGFITIEAFKSKKPVITTNDSGGVLEFVKHGETGVISNPDPKEIAENTDYLFSNNQFRINFGENGFNIVSEINWDSVIEKLTKEY
jgi:glycosyltransferase involved in cell wall biosynthesis